MLVAIKPKEGNRERWEVHIEGDKWCEIHRSIFGKNPSFPEAASWEEWQTIFDLAEYKRVKNYVIWRLSSQSYHSEQLAKLLRERLVQSKTIDRVLQEFQDSGYLDDGMWLQAFMQSQQKRYSLRLILSKLQAKGFSPDTLQTLAIEWKNPAEEVQAIQRLLQTRYRSKNLKDYKEKQKVVASLLRKGYPLDQIRHALNNINDSDSN